MRRNHLTLSLAGLGSALLLSACTSPQVGSTCPVPTAGDSKTKMKEFGKCVSQLGESVVDARLRKDVDILFLIDNSPSMSPKQKALASNIPKFIQKIDDTGANYHVGIATSDIGSNVQPGVPWGGNIGKCDSYEGDDGVLQAVPCTTRNTVTPDARNACAQLCPDDKFVPTDGRRFISKVDGVTNVPQSMERDPVTGKMVDVGPNKAFRCMALVGDDGCGIEGQMEGAKRALDGHRSENSGFLRANSVLAVIFITDEDDCSVQMAKRDQNNPSYRDCDPTQPDSPECYNVDFRCLARSIQCNETTLTTGVKTACKERANNYLEPVEKYYRFFSNLRPSNKLLVSGIWTLPSISSGGKVEIARAGGTTTPNLNRAGGAGASCVYASDQSVYGQAQLRLSKFAKQFGNDAKGQPNALEVSICDIDNYPTALDRIAKAIEQRLQAQCLPVTPKNDAAGHPICLVGDVDEASPASSPDPETAFPVCSNNCCNAWATTSSPTPGDESIKMACSAEARDCYCAVKSKDPNICTDTVVAGVWRKGGNQPPPGKVVNFRCAGGG
ncbi:MAG: VWA domain-containing protein [Myxococcales bacterium]|nr:VWA domain-containing protein [Myxococcales bacterium]